ncbi:MAG: transporter permease, partial [Bacteroidota bacterium]|nr:transporter permease [Bacteroidota bacterium]
MTNGKHASYFDAIFGITLVLFVLGLAATWGFEAHKSSIGLKENLAVEVVLRDSLGVEKVAAVQKMVEGKPYVKNVRYISKDEAAKILQKDLGENFLDILGFNPLYASFSLNLHGDFANKDSISFIKADLAKIAEVKQVNVQNLILESLDKKVNRDSFVILIVACALLVFAVSLIFNTIRLAMFSNRFTIK